MKKFLSIILATAIILSLIPAAFAVDEPLNLTIKYDLGKIINDGNFNYKDGKQRSIVEIDEKLTNGFFRFNSATSGDYTTDNKMRFYNYSGLSKDHLRIYKGNWVAFDVYVPVAGTYTMTVNRSYWKSYGSMSVYVNGNDTAVGTYSCYDSGAENNYTKYDTYTIPGFDLNKGWNTVKFAATQPDGEGNSGASISTFTLTAGTGGDALMGTYEKELTVGDTYELKTFKSSDATEVTSDLTYVSSKANVATVIDGATIKALANGKTTITVSSEDARSYDIVVTVNDPTLPTIKYDISGDIRDSAKNSESSALTENITNGFYRYKSGQGNTTNYSSATNYIKLWTKNQVTFEIYVPVAGTYTMSIQHCMSRKLTGATIYVNGATEAVGHYDCYDPDESTDYTNYKSSEFEGVTFNKGWNTVKFVAEDGSGQGSNASIGTFTLTAGTGDALMPYLNGNTTLEVDETATLSGFLSSTATAADVAYSASNDCVTVGTDGTITAAKPGKATVTMTASDSTIVDDAKTYSVDITVPDKKTDDNVSFSVAPSESAATITVDGITYDETVESVARGTEITLTANPLENYTFIGWKRGSNSDDNSYISTENPFTTTLYTNTYLTAVYAADTAEEEAVVEYYNQNGDYINTLAPEVASPTPGEIPGFTFTAGNWFIGENTKLDLGAVTKRTRAVAKHTPKADVGTATVNEIEITDKTAFDSAITPTATAGFTSWKRDGKVVSYNKDYTYYLWSATEIEQSNEALPEGKKLPIIILDDDKVDGAYMIEYDAADYEIVEVGLVFGDSTDGTPSVDSCKKKFTSQRKLSHGQMAAKYSDNVRGYLIYQDGNTYRVIYAD